MQISRQEDCGDLVPFICGGHRGKQAALAPAEQHNLRTVQPFVLSQRRDDARDVFDLYRRHNLFELFAIDFVIKRWLVADLDTAFVI